MRNIENDIKEQIGTNDIILYMKGTPSEPACGFSATAVKILNGYGVNFASVNVLDDDQIRDGIKKFSNWPTIPQIYIKGEFYGGCDSLQEMAAAGELATVLKEKGLLPS